MTDNRFFIFAAIALLSLPACGIKYKYEYSSVPNQDAFRYQLYDLYEDENGEKGIVVYREIDEDNKEGAIFVLSLDETNASWGPTDKAIFPNANESLVWWPTYAYDVNRAVYTLGADDYPAFKWCLAKNHNGEVYMGSWILPGINEWLLMINHSVDVTLLNEALVAHGGTRLAEKENYYWTATEDNPAVTLANDTEANWGFDARGRAVITDSELRVKTDKVYWSKSIIYRVRAIKYIYYYYKTEQEE